MEGADGMHGEASSGGRSSVVYCIVPRELAEKLHDPLREHFRDDSGIEIVVERRAAERRDDERRAKRGRLRRPRAERRSVRVETGRRVADRRAVSVQVAPPPLPRRARRYADRLVFVERIAPSRQFERDVDADRLVLRHQAGEEGALAELYLRYFDTVYGYARTVLRKPRPAEEVTQRVFMRMIAAAGAYEHDPSTSFRADLLAMTRDEILGEARVDGREGHAGVELGAVAGEGAPAEPGSTPALEWLSDRDVSLFVSQMPADEREVLVLHYLFDLPSERVARLLGRDVESVRTALHSALDILQERLHGIGRAGVRSERASMVVRRRPAPVLSARRLSLDGNLRRSSVRVGRAR